MESEDQGHQSWYTANGRLNGNGSSRGCMRCILRRSRRNLGHGIVDRWYMAKVLSSHNGRSSMMEALDLMEPVPNELCHHVVVEVVDLKL